MLIDTVTIPGTNYRRRRNVRDTDDSLAARIGEVTHFIVLAHYIVFTTHRNKVYSFATAFPLAEMDRPEPVELTTFHDCLGDTPFQILDLQGSFTHFAVFTASGAILTSDIDLIHDFHRSAIHQNASPPPRPSLLPSLQTGTVVSLAYGDHHLHALHNDGTITSLGKELRSCGALGLGLPEVSRFRGVLSNPNRFSDGEIPLTTEVRRTVWFDPLMEKWLNHVTKVSGISNAWSYLQGRCLSLERGWFGNVKSPA